MENITISVENNDTYSSVSNLFIDYYMTDADGEFVKVYLYLVRLLNSRKSITVSGIADHCNQTQKNICRAIKYWVKAGVLSLTYDQVDGKEVLTGITLLPLKAQNEDGKDSLTILSHDNKENTKSNTSESTVTKAKKEAAATVESNDAIATIPPKPSYTKYEIATKLNSDKDPALSELIFLMETTYFNRPLSITESQTLLYLYDELKIDIKLIEYAINYCVENGHSSLRYIEKVVLDWYSKGLNTIDKVKMSNADYNIRYIGILKYLGISSRPLTPSEKRYADTWYNDYSFDKDIVFEACRITNARNPQKPSFSYVDGILKKWQEKNVHTVDDIKKLDEQWNERKKEDSAKTMSDRANKAVTNISVKPVVNNKFHNFSQTNYDDELNELERLSLEYVNTRYGEN